MREKLLYTELGIPPPPAPPVCQSCTKCEGPVFQCWPAHQVFLAPPSGRGWYLMCANLTCLCLLFYVSVMSSPATYFAGFAHSSRQPSWKDILLPAFSAPLHLLLWFDLLIMFKAVQTEVLSPGTWPCLDFGRRCPLSPQRTDWRWKFWFHFLSLFLETLGSFRDLKVHCVGFSNI